MGMCEERVRVCEDVKSDERGGQCRGAAPGSMSPAASG